MIPLSDHRQDPPDTDQGLPDNGQGLFSPTSVVERGQSGKRLLWALPVALGLLGLLALLGPSAEQIERKFTPYGADGPLRIMPEIAVEEGIDPESKRARSETAPPPPAPEYQVEPEKTYKDAEEIAPPVVDEPAPVNDTGKTSDAPTEATLTTESDGDASVDMYLPSQNANSDFIIVRAPRPLYPLQAGREVQPPKVVTVVAGIYVNEKAEIVAVVIESNGGGPEFADAARTAVSQWELKPRMRNGVPPKPRWLRIPFHFNSPFIGLDQ